MATHWGFDGTANGWSSRGMAVFGLPLFILALHLICFYAESHGLLRIARETALSERMQR